ncbi:hypothetical protein ACJX0J_012122, partial [Zea mays]
GLGTRAVILFASSEKHSRVLVFSEDLLFIYLLPPIIFNAGNGIRVLMLCSSVMVFQVKKKQFFRNFITITLFGAVGTLISFTVISLGALGLISRLNIGALELGDYLALGAIFSATDSTPFLYSLVFGEGVVNDTTSVVLFNAIHNFDPGNISGAKLLNFISSFLYLFGSNTILGVASGLLSAYTIKKLYFGRHSTDREVSIMMLMAYLSYMLAELLDLSGILTTFLFLYVGMDALEIENCYIPYMILYFSLIDGHRGLVAVMQLSDLFLKIQSYMSSKFCRYFEKQFELAEALPMLLSFEKMFIGKISLPSNKNMHLLQHDKLQSKDSQLTTL